MFNDVNKTGKNPENSRVFDPFKYGYITEIQSQNSMLFDKVLDFAIFKAVQSKSGWRATFTLNELTTYAGTSYSSYNKTLRTTPHQRVYQIYDKEIRLFDSYKYHSGEVNIVFTDEVSLYMEDLKEFISYDVDHMFLFKRKPTQLLYKLLYAVGHKKPVRFSVYELKEYLFPHNTDVYPKWSEFNRNVLSVAKKDLDSLNQYNLMTFDYKPVLAGKGGKVNEVEFFVYYSQDDVLPILEKKEELIIDIDSVQNLLAPDIKLSKDAIKKFLPFLSDVEHIEHSKELYLSIPCVRDKGMWFYYCLTEQWWEKFIAVINSKEVIGDGMVITMHSIYYIYKQALTSVKDKNWDNFLRIINTSSVSFKLSNPAHCFLIKEIVDIMIYDYLGYNVKPNITQTFVDSMGYDIYKMIEKLRILKMCDKDYTKQFFRTYEKLTNI